MALVAGGILCTAAIALSTGRWREAAGAGLELWLAAGLLRLSGVPSWQGIGSAAAIVLIRKLVRRGLFPADSAAENKAFTLP